MVIQTKFYQTVLDDLGRFVGYRTTLNVPAQFVYDTKDFYMKTNNYHFMQIKTPRMKSARIMYSRLYHDYDTMIRDIKHLQVDIITWKQKQLQSKKENLIHSL